MKLRSASLSNFLGISEASLDLSRAVNFVFGDNGSGKSSIAEGIRFALTRTARGTDAAGKGAADLVKDGASKATVGLSFMDGVNIHAEIKGRSTDFGVHVPAGTFTGEAAKQVIRDTFGPPELLRCLTDCGRVLEMSAKEQSELLSGLFGDGCGFGEFEVKAKARGMSDEAIRALIEGVSARAPLGSPRVTPAILKDAYDGAYKARTEANATLKQLKAAPVAAPLVDAPTPSVEEIAAAGVLVSDLEVKGQELAEKLGQAKEAARAQGRLMEQEKKLQEQLAALPKVEAGEQTELAMGPSLTELETRVIVAKQAEADARTAFGDASKLLASRLAGEQALRAKAEGKPLQCDGTIGAGQPCPLAPPAKKANPAGLSIAQKLLGDAQAAEGHARTKLELSVKAHVEAVDASTAAKVAASKSAGAAEAQRTALEEQLQQLAIQIEAAGQPIERHREVEQEIETNKRALAEAKRDLEAKLYVGQQRQAWTDYSTKLTAAEAEASLMDEVTKALEPRALPLAILSESIHPFVEQVNAVLVHIAPFRISIDTEDGLSLRVVPEGGGKPRSPALLSESERLRVGAALSLALAKVSGLGFCVIDRVDALTPTKRAQFVQTVEQLGLESVIVLGSYEQPPFGADERTGVYWVEGGLVNAWEGQEVGA